MYPQCFEFQTVCGLWSISLHTGNACWTAKEYLFPNKAVFSLLTLRNPCKKPINPESTRHSLKYFVLGLVLLLLEKHNHVHDLFEFFKNNAFPPIIQEGKNNSLLNTSVRVYMGTHIGAFIHKGKSIQRSSPCICILQTRKQYRNSVVHSIILFSLNVIYIYIDYI